MAKIVITNGVIHSDEDFELRSGADANTRTRFRLCKTNTGRTRFQSLSAHTGIFKDTLEVCGNLTVHGTCTTLNTTVTATTTSATDNFTIVSTEAGASAAPDFKLYRDSASPANNDSLGHVKFSGKDAAGNETEYASLKGCVQSVTSGGECGAMLGTVVINGSSCDIFRVDYVGVWAVNNKNFYISGNGQLRNYGQCLRLSTGGGAYDIQFEPNSVLKARLNADGILFVCGKVDTPILKASSCTHYGACTSSKLTSNGDYMHHTTQYGYVQFGPGNSSYAHIQTDRSQFYFNKQLVVDSGSICSYDEDLILSRTGSTTNRINIGTAKTTSCQPMNICGSGGAAVICAAHDLDAYATIGRAKIGCMGHADWAGFAHLDQGGSGNYALLQNNEGTTILNSATGMPISFRIDNNQCALFCTDGSFTACKGIRSTGIGWIYASSYFQGCRLFPQGYAGCFHFCSGNMAGDNWMTAGRLYKGGSWLLNSQQGYMIPNTGNATCWLKFGAMCIPQHGYKMRMKVVASNGYGSSTTHSIQETTLIFQTSNASEAYSGSSVCACVHSFIEGSTRFESDAPYCFIVHEVNSCYYEFFGQFNTYTGDGSYYTVDHGPSSGWIACNAFVDPATCTGSCIVSVPNRGTIFCASASTTCICGTAIPQGDICMNNGSRGYKLGTDTAGSGSRAFLVLDRDGTDGIGSGSDYTLIAKDGGDTKIYNDGPEHIRLCSSSCVAFCKPIVGNCINATTCLRSNIIRNQTGNLYLNVYSGCNDSAAGGIYFRSCGGTSRGYVYFDGTSNFGLLNCDGTWATKIVGGQSGTIHSCHVHCFQKNIGLAGGSASRVCIAGKRAIEGNSCILSLGEDWDCICLRATCTYSTGNICTTACLQSSVVCSTGCVKTPLIQAQGGASCFSAPAGSYDDWACSPISIRERGEVSAAQSHTCYAPNLNFHWGGRVSNSLWMNCGGWLYWGSYNSTGCPEGANGLFITGTLCGNTCVKTPTIAGDGASGTYGSLEITGSKSGYGGLLICGYNFMVGCACTFAGIYHGCSNKWAFYTSCCGSTYLYYNGSAKIHTVNCGGRICNASTAYMDFCPTGGWAHFITNSSRFYANVPFSVNSGCISSYDEDLTLHRGYANSTAGERIVITSGTTHICQYTNIAGKLAVNASGLTCCCALNCGKADFEVCTGGTATAAWTGGRFRVGADDVNWTTRIRQNGYFETYSTSLNLKVATGNNSIAICPSGTGYTCVVGDLCVTGQVCADGMEGDTLSCADVCTGTICFNTGCVTGYDAVYDVYVSANPNCGGSTIYRDIVHMSVYVTTGWSGSAVTKYINHVNNFVRGAVHSSGAGTVTAVPKLLVGTTGCECYAAACATCLQIQVSGGSNKNNTCVKIKRVL